MEPAPPNSVAPESTTYRPRNVGWARAAALLYGDWGTSKAYVIGAAFLAVNYAALPIILAVTALTGLVAFNYILVCKFFPFGGGVYSSARAHSRLLAVVGSLLLVADLTVTASLSAWAALAYFHVPDEYIAVATMGTIMLVGMFNTFGPKHSGSFAVVLALPMVVIVIAIIALSLPHLTLAHVTHLHQPFSRDWTDFVGVILALSGIEAIANLTGVMKLDPGATDEHPRVGRTARKSILLVSLEVVGGTALLGWAMLSLDPGQFQQTLTSNWDDMLTQLATHYGEMAFGPHFAAVFGFATAVIVGLLLLSAVNTAIVALIGLLYLLASDGEMPKVFARLNNYGVPIVPVIIATAMPILVVLFSQSETSLMELYAIGVVGAITMDLSSCVFNPSLPMRWYERGFMSFTAVILFAVEMTLGKTKPNALYFIVCVLIGGLGLRAFGQRKARAPATILAPPPTEEPPAVAGFTPEAAPVHRYFQPGARIASGTKAIMVAARGFTPVLRFALEEAQIRDATLYVLFVRTVAVQLPVTAGGEAEPPRWEDDPQAEEVMNGAFELAQNTGIRVKPIYVVSADPGETILALAEEHQIDMLILGAPHRRFLPMLLSGNIVHEVAEKLPSHVQLVIHG